jgi:hypothetical protein
MRGNKRVFMSLVAALLFVGPSACAAPAHSGQQAGDPGMGAAKAQTASTNKAPSGTAPRAKIKFRPYEVVDQQLGGLAVSRLSVPQDWIAASRVVWNNDFYLPVHIHVRVEAPDGGSWVEFFPQEFFVWISPQPRVQAQSPGGIVHPNITLLEAMVRYVIAPNRGRASNLRILGYRPVNGLPKAFPKAFPHELTGEGMCVRVRYDLGASPVDEEFYGFMPPVDKIPLGFNNSVECHRRLLMVHSMGAKSGKLESVRPLLGFIATSTEPNPVWQRQFAQIKQQGQSHFVGQTRAQMQADLDLNVALGARNRESIQAQSNQTHAQNEAFLKRTDANLAASQAQQSAARSSFSPSANEEFYKRADDFDQNIRGTEHMQDQYGAVTDQYTDYNYHWTDGFGRFVHTDDPNFDPNRYLNGSYEQMTPVRK